MLIWAMTLLLAAALKVDLFPWLVARLDRGGGTGE